MPRGSRIAAAVLVAVYAIFWIWWGGSGDPLTPEESQAYFAELTAIGETVSHSDPATREAFRELATQDDGNEYFMVNLMKYREKALYPPGHPNHGDEDVKAAADRYSAAVFPGLIKRGSLPIFMANVQGRFLEFEGADEWDDVAIVRYRSRRDMFEFAMELGRKDQGSHKWASLEKTHVFPTTPVISFVFVRGAVGATLGTLWLAIHLALVFLTPNRESVDA